MYFADSGPKCMKWETGIHWGEKIGFNTVWRKEYK